VVIGNPLARYQEVAPDVPIDTRVEQGDPAGVILRLAAETKCDLIVLGTHGRGLIGRFLLGSVAESVVRHAICPVLTVSHPRQVALKQEPKPVTTTNKLAGQT